MEDGVGGRDDTLLSMGLLQIRIAATYISRLGLGYAPVFRGGVDRASRLEMACTMIYLITGQQVPIVSHRDAPTLAWKLGIFDLLKLENGVIIKERNLKSSPKNMNNV